jgi:hypothetical protein
MIPAARENIPPAKLVNGAQTRGNRATASRVSCASNGVITRDRQCNPQRPMLARKVVGDLNELTIRGVSERLRSDEQRSGWSYGADRGHRQRHTRD